MSAPRVAVVVPVYNAGCYLTPCLDAIAAQTLSDFVCVLVDDGSTDGSGAVCDARSAADPRFLTLHQKNAGVSAARSAGVRCALAQGAAWLAFCDGDDLYHPAFLQTLLAAAESTCLPVACCRYDTFTHTPPAEQPAGDVRPLRHPAHLKALLHDHGVDFSLCNKLFAASLLTPELLDNGFSYNEDLVTNWQIFCAVEGLAFCDWVGYHYRQHAQSASHRALAPQSIDEQRRAALFVRHSAPPDLQTDADAFYYEKLVYLASMILRRDNAADYRVQLHELYAGIRAGLWDRRLGRSPALPFFIRISAIATALCPRLWRRVCRALLKDRR